MNLRNGLNYSGKLINFKQNLTLNVSHNIYLYLFISMYVHLNLVDSSRQKGLMAVQLIGSIVLRVICYSAALTFLYFNAAKSVLSLDLFKSEIEAVPLAQKLMAFPSAEKGEISVTVWALITSIAMKELFNFL